MRSGIRNRNPPELGDFEIILPNIGGLGGRKAIKNKQDQWRW